MPGRHEVFLKLGTDKNGRDYYKGWSKQTGTITIFLWPEGDKGYAGKLLMSSRVRKKRVQHTRGIARNYGRKPSFWRGSNYRSPWRKNNWSSR